MANNPALCPHTDARAPFCAHALNGERNPGWDQVTYVSQGQRRFHFAPVCWGRALPRRLAFRHAARYIQPGQTSRECPPCLDEPRAELVVISGLGFVGKPPCSTDVLSSGSDEPSTSISAGSP